jgi:hypothetical protein
MSKRGKVGTGGQEIMAKLWGNHGRPETNAYADRCAANQLEVGVGESLVPSEGDKKIAKEISERVLEFYRACFNPVETDRV